MKRIVFLVLLPFLAQAQNTQTIRGSVVDQVTQQAIVGATVYLNPVESNLATVTNEEGFFEIDMVPLGRHDLSCTYLGYKDCHNEGIVVNVANAIFIEIALAENVLSLDEVVVQTSQKENLPVNELSIISTRSFSADETSRIPAAANDPGRMALAYAGVTQGTDDTENEILIRGNASFGMLWRLEGVDIPNPNHFARVGSSAGGITAFSAQVLSRSDFSSGGMSSEYGNTLSGVMDIHFRKGDKFNRAHRLKVGLLGLEVGTEGPIKNGISSYLLNYRYSTLGMLSKLGVHLIGERVDNDFQDLSFNVAFGRSEKHQFTLWGLGGLSTEHKSPVQNPLERDSLESDHSEDRIRKTNIGVLGTSYTNYINTKSYLKISLAGIASEISRHYDVLDEEDMRFNYRDERHFESRLSASLNYSLKINPSLRLKTGLFANYIGNYEFFKKSILREEVWNIFEENENTLISGEGNTYTLQYYAHLQKSFNKLSFNLGAHFLFFGLNNTSSLDPRLSIQYKLDNQKRLTLSYGAYSKYLPMATYFYQSIISTEPLPNRELPLIKADHWILSYKQTTDWGITFTTEAYYQFMKNIPVGIEENDFYWMLNERKLLSDRAVEGTGKGENYGLDLSIEKFFSDQFFFLLTGSFYKSYFYPKNGKRYHSTLSGDFSSALTMGKEFEFTSGNIFQIGFRVLLNGGQRYSPLDESASLSEGIYVPDYSNYNSLQLPNYFRIDARMSYQFNKNKLAGNISLDIQNNLNRSNFRGVNYNVIDNELVLRTHSSGLVPILAFQLDF